MRKPKRRFIGQVESMERRDNPSYVIPPTYIPPPVVLQSPIAPPAYIPQVPAPVPTPLKPIPLPQDPSLPPLKPDNPPLEPHLPASADPVQYPNPAMTVWETAPAPSIYPEGAEPPSGPSAFDPNFWNQPATSDPIDIYKPYDPAGSLMNTPPKEYDPVYTPSPDGLQNPSSGGTPRDTIDPINGIPAPPDNGIPVAALASASPISGVPYVIPVAYVESAPPRAYNPANDPAWPVNPTMPRTTGPYDPNDPLQFGVTPKPPTVEYGPKFNVPPSPYDSSIKPLPAVPALPPAVYPF